jgi:hypothetical protein
LQEEGDTGEAFLFFCGHLGGARDVDSDFAQSGDFARRRADEFYLYGFAQGLPSVAHLGGDLFGAWCHGGLRRFTAGDELSE